MKLPKPVQMTLSDWDKKYDRAAKKEGWSLFDTDGTIEIAKIDDPEDGDAELDSDLTAISLVFANAAKGDPKSLLALMLDGRPTYRKGFDRYPNLRQEKYHVVRL